MAMIPALPGVALFGTAFGALAAERGLSVLEAVLMSGLVFAGVSQIASMELWSPQVTPALVLTIAFTTLVINLRMLLMGASMRPWLADAPPLQVYPGLYILTDTNWVSTLRYRREGGADAGFLFGGGLIVWFTFVPSTAIGQIFGTLLANPRPYGVDMILPLYFVALLAPMFESARRSVPWAIAGLVAIAVQSVLPGFWYLIAGTLAGAVAGGLLGDE
ncbi:AzlC family ABC transporter permease [Pseudorhodoplanes sp.]|uniref:AzlC family ABC transporter permease n=1 Tax=Pseudorhodoplanes sp. TaxID=1934341 RepID=UPI002CB62327|nr:AzlC family ABC transporter permease [Pseudorhodoplanes sp.]HWV51471.1 AzlC family ABC transporter permease [Pseudorhodoplanes sp.]